MNHVPKAALDACKLTQTSTETTDLSNANHSKTETKL